MESKRIIAKTAQFTVPIILLWGGGVIDTFFSISGHYGVRTASVLAWPPCAVSFCRDSTLNVSLTDGTCTVISSHWLYFLSATSSAMAIIFEATYFVGQHRCRATRNVDCHTYHCRHYWNELPTHYDHIHCMITINVFFFTHGEIHWHTCTSPVLIIWVVGSTSADIKLISASEIDDHDSLIRAIIFGASILYPEYSS